MKPIPYAFYVTDIQLKSRIFDLRVDQSQPLGKFLKTTVSQTADPTLAAMNAAIDRHNCQPDQSGLGSTLPGNFYLSQFE